MPGTIHVAVLEFKGFSSPSKPSAKSLKVSMGKRQYQTWGKGNFSFPITKIRENLVVALLDAGGNKIAHQDIQTMQIIEKGSWDEVFSINGAGHVHMKLQFTLSEEDRNRVRFMRESVMKKKLEMDPSIKLRLEEAVTPTSDSSETIMNAEQKVSGIDNIDPTIPKAEASPAVSLPGHQMDGGLILDGEIPVKELSNATDGRQDAPSSSQLAGGKPGNEEAPSSPKFPRSSVSNQKTPSSVRKMISAFESSQLQGVKTMKRAVSVPSQLNKVGKDDRVAETVIPPAAAEFEGRHLRNMPSTTSGTDSEVLKPAQAGKELDSNERPTDPYAEDMPRESSSKEILNQGEESAADVLETASSSGRTSEELSSKSVSLSESAGGGTGFNLKSSTMIHIQEECQSSGMWIFPDNARRLCTTTGGEQVMTKVGEAKTHQTNSNSKNPMHEKEEHKIEKKSKKSHQQPESGSTYSPDDSSHGLVGQVIKIAVIVGFGVLVLLTRQKEPRKKHKEEKDHLFHTPDYERTSKPWTGKQ